MGRGRDGNRRHQPTQAQRNPYLRLLIKLFLMLSSRCRDRLPRPADALCRNRAVARRAVPELDRRQAAELLHGMEPCALVRAQLSRGHRPTSLKKVHRHERPYFTSAYPCSFIPGTRPASAASASRRPRHRYRRPRKPPAPGAAAPTRGALGATIPNLLRSLTSGPASATPRRRSTTAGPCQRCLARWCSCRSGNATARPAAAVPSAARNETVPARERIAVSEPCNTSKTKGTQTQRRETQDSS